tara:strand:- start:308 stop:1036 length:729 start_codon:yes stop_codon:yes gene_type:complete
MQKTIIVIPCYNEGARLPSGQLNEYFSKQDGISCLLVNDGSSDNTGQLIDQLATENENIKALHLNKNSGKAEAVRQGIMAALKDLPNYVGYWDADMATPLEYIPLFISYFDKDQFFAVTGCRLSRLGARVIRKPLRHYLGRIFATTVSTMLKLQVYDTQCGAKIFKADLAEKIFNRPFKTKWLFDVELYKRIVDIHGAEKTSSSIYELPLEQWIDVGGSKLKFTTMLKVPFQLVKIFMFNGN